MFIASENRETSVLGAAGATTAFSIAANGKAFKILIDGLYSNKELAVVRELWTNAYDSHIMAGTVDRPFDCHLPSSWEPWFAVRDYGVGMSHDYMMNGYTLVFHSTKDHSNEQVGALGLGRMSPFCKTDTFTVTSWTNGIQRTYSVFLNNARIPTISLMGEQVSDEPNGVEVKIPVESRDNDKFQYAASQCTLGFDVMPNVQNHKVGIAPPTVISRGDKWKMMGSRDDLHISGAYARQGCVVYRLDANALPKITDGQRALLRSALLIDFAIGELDITANREDLSYDETTQNNIQARLDIIESDICAQYQTQINTAETMWRAHRLRVKMLAALPENIARVLRGKLRWRNRRIEHEINLHSELDRLQKMVDKPVAVTYLSKSTLNSGKHYGGKRRKIDWEATKYTTVSPDDTIIMFEDVNALVYKGGLRIRNWNDTQGSNTSNVLWVRGTPGSIAFKRLLARLGRPEVMNVADLPKPERAAPGTAKTKVKMRVLDTKSYSASWVETDIVEQDENFYVELKRKEVLKADGSLSDMSTGTLKRVMDLLKTLGALPLDARLIGVPASCKAVLKRNQDTWLSLWEIVDETLTNRFKPEEYSDAQQYKQIVRETDDLAPLARQLIIDGKDTEVVDCAGPFGVLLVATANAKVMAEMSAEQETLGRLYYEFNVRVCGDDQVLVDDFNRINTAALEAYPLLKHADSSDRLNPDYQKHAIHYVNLIDADNQKAQDVKQDTIDDSVVDLAA